MPELRGLVSGGAGRRTLLLALLAADALLGQFMLQTPRPLESRATARPATEEEKGHGLLVAPGSAVPSLFGASFMEDNFLP